MRVLEKLKNYQSQSHLLLISDKAGEVCSFSVTDPYQEKEWILGHVTMLLDVVHTFFHIAVIVSLNFLCIFSWLLTMTNS